MENSHKCAGFLIF